MRPQRFLLHFTAAFLTIAVLIEGFVTWLDPFRNLNYPWSTRFISDRNPGYKRFTLLQKAQGITDLVIGSSTSEAFVPKVLAEHFKVRAFAANTGGASLPLRLLMAQAGLATQPELKRIIWVADLFEFVDPTLESTVYYQPEMIRSLDPELAARCRPKWTERFTDYFSSLVIDRSFRTLKDLLQFERGSYVSAYHEDGSTTQSMIGGREGEPLDKRVRASAVGMLPLYGELSALHPRAIEIYRRLQETLAAHPSVQLHLVITPFHEGFYRQFEAHFARSGIYAEWTRFLQTLSAPNLHVHDFSWPIYKAQGIGLDDRYWQDGTHFTSFTMLQMAARIYPP